MMRCWWIAALLGLLAAGCAAPPPAPPAPEPVPLPHEEPPPPPPPPCTCDEPNREVARLRHELANKEVELRDLRAQHRDQLKALQESSRQAARAMVKVHRTASQAEAAAFIAEIEVLLQTKQAAPDAGSKASLIAVAEGMLQSATLSFKRGDYGAAMDCAAQAQQLLVMLSDRRVRLTSSAQRSAEVPFQVPIPLRLKTDSHLRREPRGNAKVVTVLKQSTTLNAIAYKGNWLHVEVNGGRQGWVYQGLFAQQ